MHKPMRLSQLARELNITTSVIIEYLNSCNIKIEDNPNVKLTIEQTDVVLNHFALEKQKKEKLDKIVIGIAKEEHKLTNTVSNTVLPPLTNSDYSTNKPPKTNEKKKSTFNKEIKVSVQLLDDQSQPSSPPDEVVDLKNVDITVNNTTTAMKDCSQKLNIKGFINLNSLEMKVRPDKSTNNNQGEKQRYQNSHRNVQPRNSQKRHKEETIVNNNEVQKRINQTLSKKFIAKAQRTIHKLQYKGRKEEHIKSRIEKNKSDDKLLKITEFISIKELSGIMEISTNELIAKCLDLGITVSINQRLDKDVIQLLVSEFGFRVEFQDLQVNINLSDVEDVDESNLETRMPIVTIMGHVDHGKTSLLDYLRNSKITAKEAGGITQHLGAYSVQTKSGKKIVFLDTPGHEAFIAMRARGVEVADIVIIIIAADDGVQPQTVEALTQAKNANVHIVFAINKIDKEGVNPDKVREALANLNFLVEDWGGEYQCQNISALTGKGVDELLEKISLEADLMNLKADYSAKAQGTVLEASLNKGRGYVNTFLVRNGTLHSGDICVAGTHSGKIKMMLDDEGNCITNAIPSTPVQVLGLDGAARAGDIFTVVNSEKEAHNIALKRAQLMREQTLKSQKRLTIEEFERRVQLGNYHEINVIIKGDTDGSVQAISDSLSKLSTENIVIKIVDCGVGEINDNNILYAKTTNSTIVAFQTKPSTTAKKLAVSNKVEIKYYSIIYDIIEDFEKIIKTLQNDGVEEGVIRGHAEVKALFKISKVGMIAGCLVTDGPISITNKVRVIRDGNVIHSADISQLKHYKSDVKEVKASTECGVFIAKYSDYKVGDILEFFEMVKK